MPSAPRVPLLILLAGVAGVCQAQSVTLYGKLDAGFRRDIGSSAKQIATSGDSRIGFRGTEPLGNGLTAFFGMEHRFFPDTGAIDGSQFWKGYSQVGLSGDFGRISLGRLYTAAFSLVQNRIDPFEGDTVAQLRDVAMRSGGITKVRINGALRYEISHGRLGFAASVAEGDKNGGPKRASSAALSYKDGGLYLAAGLEDPAGARDRQWSAGVAYTVKGATWSAGMSHGRTDAGKTARGQMLGLSLAAGPGEFKAALGSQKLADKTVVQKLGLGYHYSLSKRTIIYADMGHDSKALRDKTGLDLGIRHQF